MKRLFTISFLISHIAFSGQPIPAGNRAVDALQKQQIEALINSATNLTEVLSSEKILVLQTNGTRTAYSDIDVAWSNIVSGTTMYIPNTGEPWVFDSTAKYLTDLSDITLIGIGRPEIIAEVGTTAKDYCYRIYHCTNIYAEGITFTGIISPENYNPGGHAYNWNCNSGGRVVDCDFVMLCNVDMPVSYHAVNIVTLRNGEADRMLYDRCNLLTYASVPGDNVEHINSHYDEENTGLYGPTFRLCNMVGIQVEEPPIINNPDFIDCSINEPNSVYGLSLINVSEARSFTPAAYKYLVTTNDCFSRVTSQGDNEIMLYCAGITNRSAYYDFFTVTPDSSVPGTDAYPTGYKVSGFIGWNQPQSNASICYFDYDVYFISTNSVTIVTNYLDNATSGFINIGVNVNGKFNIGAKQHFNVSRVDPAWISGQVYYRPMWFRHWIDERANQTYLDLFISEQAEY